MFIMQFCIFSCQKNFSIKSFFMLLAGVDTMGIAYCSYWESFGAIVCNCIFCLRPLKNTIGPTSGFTGPYIACDYCYGAIPQNPSRYTSGDPWR